MSTISSEAREAAERCRFAAHERDYALIIQSAIDKATTETTARLEEWRFIEGAWGTDAHSIRSYIKKIEAERDEIMRDKELLKEQIRVADVAFNHLHGEHKALLQQPNSHAGDCTIYSALMNGNPEDGICTCGYGWSLVRKSDPSQMYSEERLAVMKSKETAE